METLKLVPETDPILHEVMPEFDFNGEIDSVELFEKMKETMCREKGLGLSANQVGIRARMFVIGDPDNPDSCIAVFNPRIVDEGNETIELDEGCLSFKNIFMKVKRPKTIRARYENEHGETFTHNFTGITARAFLHEYDHLNGITFKDVVSRLKWGLAEKKKEKFEKKARR